MSIEQVLTAVTTLSNLVMAGGIIFVWMQFKLLEAQLKLLQLQIRDDHERGRREALISVMREWNRDLKPETAAAQKLVARLTESECRMIENLLEVQLANKHHPLTIAALGPLAPPFNAENGSFLLGIREVAHLRFLINEYFNALETSLSAWRLGIVDISLMEEQFSFLLDNTVTDASLKVYRSILGTNNGLPSLEAFIKKASLPSKELTPTGQV
jgi:hypothetical protein